MAKPEKVEEGSLGVIVVFVNILYELIVMGLWIYPKVGFKELEKQKKKSE